MLFDPLLLCIQFKHKLVKSQWLLQCGTTLVSRLSQCAKSAVIQNHSLYQEHSHTSYPSTNCLKHIPQDPHLEYFCPGVSNRKPSHWAYRNYRKGPYSIPRFFFILNISGTGMKVCHSWMAMHIRHCQKEVTLRITQFVPAPTGHIIL